MKSLKNQNFLLVVLLLLSSISLLSAFAHIKKDLPTFTSIALRTSAEVYLKQGAVQSVVLEGSEKAKKEVQTSVKNGKLTIKTESNEWGWSNSSGKLKIYITVKDLEALSVSGSGSIIGSDKFTTDDLKLSVSGSGDIEMDVDADDMEIRISGSGNVQLKGKSKNNSVSISGSGDLEAKGLEADKYQVSISGSGECSIHVNSEINSRVSGSGSVYYKGSPSKINSKTSGSGKVKKI